jgi:predicted transcriptional regulator
MAKLYELVGGYRNLLEMADSESGEEFLAILETLSDAIDTKVETCAKVVKNLQADAAALKEEEARLSARRKSVEGNIDRLKAYMKENMTAADKQKIKTALFTIYITAGRPTVVVDNEEVIPSEYRAEVKTPPPDKKGILEALKAGKQVPGVTLGVTEPSLTIR